MKSIRFLAGIAIMASLMACKDSGSEIPVITHSVVSDCHTYTDAVAAKEMSTDSVVLSWPGGPDGPLQVTHYNMVLDCGGANIVTRVEQDGDVVTAVESVGEQGITDCICLYDNMFLIDGLPPRPFTLVIKIESLFCGVPSQTTVFQETIN